MTTTVEKTLFSPFDLPKAQLKRANTTFLRLFYHFFNGAHLCKNESGRYVNPTHLTILCW